MMKEYLIGELQEVTKYIFDLGSNHLACISGHELTDEVKNDCIFKLSSGLCFKGMA